MTLVPITVKDLQAQYSLHQELTPDFLTDKIILASAAFFCVATELRILKRKTKDC